jgi:hypothetical protein
MARIALTGGSYTARSIIANCQRSVNLYPEVNPPDAQSPAPVTHYLTPGLIFKLVLPDSPVRQVYRSSNGQLFAVAGSSVYYIDPALFVTNLGSITTSSGTPYFADNGLAVVLVDGSPNGYAIDLATHSFGPIDSNAFYGGGRVDYVDTYFLFTRPGTNQWYISLSESTYDMLVNSPIATGTITNNGSSYTNGTYTNVPLTGGAGTGAIATILVQGAVITGCTVTDFGTGYRVGNLLHVNASDVGGTGSGFTFQVLTAGAFDQLDIAAKVGYPDPLASLIVMHREIWLIGTLTTEIWYNSGAADFTFQQMPGSFIEHGCIAPYSVGKEDLSIFWLSQDLQGQCIVIQGTNYQAKRISTHAIENEFSGYPVVSDAIGFTYQQEGHVFYQLSFPAANKTWVYDVATSLWHERTWTDADGNENRHRANCGAFAYGLNLVGDWQNGNVYAYDLGAYTDFGGPIVRRRGFPHIVDDGKRMFHRQFIADMEVGSATGLLVDDKPLVSLRWSDTRGASWGTPITLSMGSTGEYLVSMQAQRLGMARDRIYELSWSEPYRTALNGAWLDTKTAMT